MKRRSILLTLAALFAGVLVCFAAADVQMGTWKLNEAKSKISPGTPKNTNVVYAAEVTQEFGGEAVGSYDDLTCNGNLATLLDS